MRRLVVPGVAWLLVAVTSPAAAQRPANPTAVELEEPRPAPIFPVALVPFSIPAELCRGGRVPVVTLEVSNVLGQVVAPTRLRSRERQVIERLRLRCGRYVAIWDGTIDNGSRIAPPFIYYFSLSVTLPGSPLLRDTFKLVVPAN